MLGETFHDYFFNASVGYHTHLTRLTNSGTVLEAKYGSSIVTRGVTGLTTYPDGGTMMFNFFGTVVTRLDANLEQDSSMFDTQVNILAAS